METSTKVYIGGGIALAVIAIVVLTNKAKANNVNAGGMEGYINTGTKSMPGTQQDDSFDTGINDTFKKPKMGQPPLPKPKMVNKTEPTPVMKSKSDGNIKPRLKDMADKPNMRDEAASAFTPVVLPSVLNVTTVNMKAGLLPM